jgi:hypothetical protein
VKAGDLTVRAAQEADRAALRAFRCSTGDPWEDLVEQQITGPLPSRFLASPPDFDGRLVLVLEGSWLLTVGAHRIEPTFAQDVGYVEVVAVALDARGTLVELPGGDQLSLGHFVLLTMFKQMNTLGRDKRTFARVDRRNTRSLALLTRAGLTTERQDADPALVQRWGVRP